EVCPFPWSGIPTLPQQSRLASRQASLGMPRWANRPLRTRSSTLRRDAESSLWSSAFCTKRLENAVKLLFQLSVVYESNFRSSLKKVRTRNCSLLSSDSGKCFLSTSTTRTLLCEVFLVDREHEHSPIANNRRPTPVFIMVNAAHPRSGAEKRSAWKQTVIAGFAACDGLVWV